MSSIGDGTRNLRTRAHKAPNQEERGFHVVPREHIEQVLGVNIVRTIIVSKRKMLGIGAVRQSAPVELRLRRVAVIGKVSCSGERACNNWF